VLLNDPSATAAHDASLQGEAELNAVTTGDDRPTASHDQLFFCLAAEDNKPAVRPNVVPDDSDGSAWPAPNGRIRAVRKEATVDPALLTTTQPPKRQFSAEKNTRAQSAASIFGRVVELKDVFLHRPLPCLIFLDMGNV
jgi:hypothetical protein